MDKLTYRLYGEKGVKMKYKPKTIGALAIPFSGGYVTLHVNQRWNIRETSALNMTGKIVYIANLKFLTLRLKKEEVDRYFEKV